MKILYVIGAFYPSQIGGPCNAISWLVKAVKKEGVSTTVVSTMCGIDAGKHGIIPDQWIENEFGRVIYHTYNSMNLPFKLIWTSLRLVKRNDVIHLNSIFHPPMLIIAAWAILLNKKIMWDPGGELASEALKFGTRKKQVYLKLFRFVCQNLPVFHTTSSKESDDIRVNLGSKSKVFEVPNYIEDIPMHAADRNNSLLFLGRLHPIKAIDNLILAVNESSFFRSKGYKLLIAGDDSTEYAFGLKALVEKYQLNDAVIFVGHMEGDLKFKLLAQSKFMVLPSHSENFGNVVTEAMSQKTPIIASNGTPWQILATHNAGFFCSNDPSILSSVIDQAIGLPDSEYNQMCENTFNLLEHEFHIKHGVFKWLSVYKNMESSPMP